VHLAGALRAQRQFPLEDHGVIIIQRLDRTKLPESGKPMFEFAEP
jgi:hypothetical protein